MYDFLLPCLTTKNFKEETTASLYEHDMIAITHEYEVCINKQPYIQITVFLQFLISGLRSFEKNCIKSFRTFLSILII